MLSLTRNTVGNVYAVTRHYCGRDLQDRPFIPIGGRVFIIKSDESQFKHKSKEIYVIWITFLQLLRGRRGVPAAISQCLVGQISVVFLNTVIDLIKTIFFTS